MSDGYPTLFMIPTETGFVVVKVKGVVLVCDPALVTWLAPLPMIFPTGSEFSPGPVPFSPTASDDGGLTFSDERSQDLPRGEHPLQ